MPRRSVTIAENLHDRIQIVRGKFLTNKVDADYTTVLNLAAVFGISHLETLLKGVTKEEEWGLLAMMIEDPKFKTAAAFDKYYQTMLTRMSQTKN